MIVQHHDSITRLALIACLLMLVGCSQPPAPPGSLNSTSVAVGKSLATIHQFGGRIALVVWFGESEPNGCGYSENDHAFTGSVRTANGQTRSWSCKTTDGVQGKITWWGDSIPKNAVETSDVAKGTLLLVTTKGGEMTVQQIRHDFNGITPDKSGLAHAKTLVEELAKSNEAVKQFLADDND